MRHHHFHFPPIYVKQIIWESDENPNVRFYYQVVDGVLTILSMYHEITYGDPPVTKWKPVPRLNPAWTEMRILLDEMISVWYGSHGKWNFTEGNRNQWEEYGSQLNPARTGMELAVDALIPTITNWEEDPQYWYLNLNNPPEIVIQER